MSKMVLVMMLLLLVQVLIIYHWNSYQTRHCLRNLKKFLRGHPAGGTPMPSIADTTAGSVATVLLLIILSGVLFQKLSRWSGCLVLLALVKI